ncbi:MAG TPA: hypothetical protein PLZ55_14455 [bacterium]|nr:hypothetical protein [bacterium]HQO34973.1 hypothetical protein [bacterium]HQP97410.1 hypothetical protein [bacterium]
MNVDAIVEWINETLPEILKLIFLLAILAAIFWAVVMFLRRQRKQDGRERMTQAQMKAEEDAVQKLLRAQQLLMESDQNVTEAQKLRDQVVVEDLPKHKIRILGKDPNSLLMDIDSRIRGANIRLHRTAAMESSQMPYSEDDDTV